MNYFDENKTLSLYEFFKTVDKQVAAMYLDEKYTEVDVTKFKNTVMALQFHSRQYITRNEKYPVAYPIVNADESMDYAEVLFPILHDVYEYFVSVEEGTTVAKKIDFHFSLSNAVSTKQQVEAAGVEDSIKERIVSGVINSLINVYNIAINQYEEDFTDADTKIINGDKIVDRYPEYLYVLQDEVSQKIFKSGVGLKADKDSRYKKRKLDRTGNPNIYNIRRGNIITNGQLVVDSRAAQADRATVENYFSYYDWAVMEAVASIYDDAVSRGMDSNGKVIIDIKSVHQVVNFGKRMSSEKQQNLVDSELFKSLQRLMGNYIHINEKSADYDGCLIDGDFGFFEGKHCIILHKEPVLIEYLKNNGRNDLKRYLVSELDLGLSRYNEERIAIYRYLRQRTLEIFGSYKSDDKHKKVKIGSSNSIPIQNIIDAVYPDFNTRFKDKGGKKRDFKKNVQAVIDKMISKHYFEEAPNSVDGYVLNRK